MRKHQEASRRRIEHYSEGKNTYKYQFVIRGGVVVSHNRVILEFLGNLTKCGKTKLIV